MFRVFSDQEIQLWKDWTLSLVKKASTKPLDSFDSMVLLLKTLKGQQQGNEQHNAIEIMEAGKNKAHPISWWFTQDPAFFMAALSDVRNNLIVLMIQIAAFLLLNLLHHLTGWDKPLIT